MHTVIIVPVDFSAASVNAANYAAGFAVATGADMALINIFYSPASSGGAPLPGECITQLFDEANKNITELQQDLLHRTNHNLKIAVQVSEGNIISQVKEYCETFPHAIVVMGTHVTSASERIIFGSTSLSAMRSLSFPLIIVPTGTRFTGIAVAGLACDLQDIENTVNAAELKQLFSQFHPQLNILHVTTKKHGMLNEEEISGAKRLKEMLADFNPSFHFMQNENIEEAIRQFSEENNLSLLIVIPKKHGLFNRLLHQSQSKQMIINTHIPVMSVHG